MSDLGRALGGIRSIRRQLAHSTEFRAYGPATLAATAGLAVVAAVGQSLWLPDPADHLRPYLAIWFAAAILSAAVIGVQTAARSRRMHSGMAHEMIRMAIEKFLPCVVAGALLTLVIERAAPFCRLDDPRALAGDLQPRHLFLRAVFCRAPFSRRAPGIC